MKLGILTIDSVKGNPLHLRTAPLWIFLCGTLASAHAMFRSSLAGYEAR